jgi:Peptidase M15
LRTVLADVAAQFGTVTVVSTHQLNTANHSSGSIRERLHHDCKAVDIRPDRSRIDEIKAHLRTRREVGGVESYRNGIIHIDVSGTAVAGAVRPRGRADRAQAETGSADAVQAASPPQEASAASAFAPVVPERYR